MLDKLMIVAHPDDESIFGGAALLKELGWKVICLTNGNYPLRAFEFFKAMKLVGASCEIWDYPDQFDGKFDKAQLLKDLNKVLRKNTYNCIVTHNLQGEYGHSQHKSLSKILHEQNFENLYVFNKSNVMLPYELLRKKLNLLSAYKSQIKGNIEHLMDYIVYENIVLSINENVKLY
ncbi:PIG-L family deacetylase [Bacillus cereus group sp. BfR-BA-01350]|uniref:PIG-L family deacetylase n=1 Tax=Bacillus cereus group sp. BfR-BA-01350 TaxID=2920313 RepID=UPI001F5A8B8B|nr:PIG-L family deacetylase [Bacillus cereus group sp. BfR-BA-01350]